METQEIIVHKRTEEVRDIIDRMPNTFARNITFLVCTIVGLLVLLGYIIKYPDIVTGEVTVSADQAPLQILAEESGRLNINNIKSQDLIKSGQLLAWIENPARPDQVTEIHNLVLTLKLPTSRARSLYDQFPKHMSLGDLTIPYSSFLSSLKQLADYQDHKVYDKQSQSLGKILKEQNAALGTLSDKERIGRENLKISDKFLERDSILLAKRIISQAEYERSVAAHLSAEDQLRSSQRNTGSVREQISNTESTIQQNNIAKSEKELQLELEVLTTYNNLIDKLNLWRKQYLISSPVEGKAQFLKFWSNKQFVKAGEPIFSIVPDENTALGKVMLPVQGAGKVKVGQKVIVKMADYPYMEYGYIEARVKDISLVSNTVSLGNGTTIDSYLVTLTFPDGLLTNYGSRLDFRFESKGTAEIITKDRRLIERFFDNLKYIGHAK